jgi:hypothetical protein
MVPVLSQMNPDHTFPPYFPKIHSNTIIQPTPTSSEWSLPSGFPPKKNYAYLISPMRTTFPAPLTLLDFIKRTSVFSRLPLRYKYSPQHPLLKPSVYVIPLVSETRFLTHIKTAGKTIVLYTLNTGFKGIKCLL